MSKRKTFLMKGFATIFILLTILAPQVLADSISPFPSRKNPVMLWLTIFMCIVLVILSYFIYVIKNKKNDDD